MCLCVLHKSSCVLLCSCSFVLSFLHKEPGLLFCFCKFYTSASVCKFILFTSLCVCSFVAIVCKCLLYFLFVCLSCLHLQFLWGFFCCYCLFFCLKDSFSYLPRPTHTPFNLSLIKMLLVFVIFVVLVCSFFCCCCYYSVVLTEFCTFKFYSYVWCTCSICWFVCLYEFETKLYFTFFSP